MKKVIFAIALISLMAAGCNTGVTLKQEIPTSPAESYQPLPK